MILQREYMMKAKLSWLGAILFGLFFLITDINIAHRRLFWFDEIGTLKIAKLPDLAAVWQVQTSALADSAPIVYHLLIRLFYNLSGHAEISIRIVSALAMSAALLVVFDCARRLTDGTHGLIALCVLGGSFLPFYGHEGRPYALAALFTAIVLWLWLHTRVDSKLSAAAFGVAIFLALMMHFNMVLVLVPFGLWELYRWRPWRRPSWKLLAGVAGMLCAFGVSMPQMKQAAAWSASSWCPPSASALVTVLSNIFPTGLFVLAALGILVSLLRTVARPMTDAEQVCWLFLAVPIAGFVLAEAVTNAFYDRYLIAVLPGVAVAFACLVSRHLTKPASIALLLMLSALVVGRQIRTAQRAERIEPGSAPQTQAHTREVQAAEDTIVADGRTTIITDFVLLASARYYSKRPDLYVMYGPDSDPLFCKYYGSACWNLDSAKTHATEVAAVYPSGKLVAEMRQAGFEASVKMTSPLLVYFSRR